MPDVEKADKRLLSSGLNGRGFVKERGVTLSEIYCAICSREKPANRTAMALESTCEHNKIFTYWV